MLNEKDKEQVIEALRVCSSCAPDKCDKCPFQWLADHGQDCQVKMAEWVLELFVDNK